MGRSPKSTSSDDGSTSFDDGLERLEALLERLEGGELPLEESLGVFEQGIRLSRELSERLEAAERRVEVLLREGDRLVTRPLDEGTSEESD